MDTFYNMTEFPAYHDSVITTRTYFRSLGDYYWVKSLHNNWVYSLMPLWYPKPAGFPQFMRTPAWETKELTTSMSSWTELRHDMILYAKQSISSIGIPPQYRRCFGYVEPNPELYGRIAALCKYMIEAEGITDEHRAIRYFESDIESLKMISEKELSNIPLSAREYCLITKLGIDFQAYSMDSLNLAEYPSWMETGDPPDPEKSPLVADVHTACNTFCYCLEEGTGYPAKIYVIVPYMGRLILTEGGILPHYAFWNPISARLTDSLWQIGLKDSVPPLPDLWSANLFASDVDFTRGHIDLWTWGVDEELHFYTVILESDTFEIGDTINISNTFGYGYFDYYHYTEYWWTGGNIQSTYKIYWEGDSSSIESDTDGVALLNTTGLPVGKVRVWATPTLAHYRDLFFGTEFYVKNRESIAKTTLPENPDVSIYPNPFNASCRINSPDGTIVEIYDISGLTVAKLTGGDRIWKPANEIGSGVYFMRAKIGDKTLYKRLVYLK
jgi:hypothetical protein